MEVESLFPRRRGRELKSDKVDPISLVSGPPSCGKTSLLFQFAFNAVSESDHGIVLFICRRRNIESNPPFLSQDIDQCSDTFKRIHMKYVDDYEDLNKYFAAFHLYREFPRAVVVDDFGDFFDERRCRERYGNNIRGKELAMVRMLALCHDAISLAKKPCQLVLSETHHGGSPRFLFVYKRWVSTIFTITDSCTQGDGCGSFSLKSIDSQENGSSSSYGKTKIAKYSIVLHSLDLEGITTQHFQL